MAIRLLQVGGSALVRRGVSQILDGIDDIIEVVGKMVQVGASLHEADGGRDPDVILLHLHMKGFSDSAVTAWLRELLQRGTCRVLLMMQPGDGHGIWRAIRAGVDGYVYEDDSPEKLAAAISSLAAGETWLPAPLVRELVDHYRWNTIDRSAPAPAAEILSDRERGVVHLVAMGLSNSEVAARLGLAESTIKTHVSRILRKLQLRDRTQLTRFAYEARIV